MTAHTMTPNRLRYHITPPYGLMNDPNGLVYFAGRHHVFYQWNQNGTIHKTKSWGHVSSADLIHWQTHPAALEPTDWFDKDGCYSGSAVVHGDKLYLFYTGNVRNEKGERESYQCLAISEDGIHFEKKGPMELHLEGYTDHVRDPKVWQEKDGSWRLIIGAQTLAEKGSAILFRSTDLWEWEEIGRLDAALPDFGYMWECPDLVRGQEQDLLLFCPQGLEGDGTRWLNLYQAGFLIGQLQPDGIFHAQTKFEEVDAGFEFYAPQTYQAPDGRTIMYGWLGLMPPEDEQSFPTIEEGWIHSLTLPRRLRIEGEQLVQEPVRELQQLRLEETFAWKEEELLEQDLTSLEQEILLEWQQEAEDFLLRLRDELEIRYSKQERKVSVIRTNWRTGQRETRSAILDQPLTEMRLFLEPSSLELFVNGGRTVFSLRYIAAENNQRFSWQEETANASITFYRLRAFEGLL